MFSLNMAKFKTLSFRNNKVHQVEIWDIKERVISNNNGEMCDFGKSDMDLLICIMF